MGGASSTSPAARAGSVPSACGARASPDRSLVEPSDIDRLTIVGSGGKRPVGRRLADGVATRRGIRPLGVEARLPTLVRPGPRLGLLAERIHVRAVLAQDRGTGAAVGQRDLVSPRRGRAFA